MNIRRFNLGTMLSLLDIDQHRSINAAARARDVSQPSLSRGLQSFEAALGVPLFTRTANGVEPTPFGDTLLYHTRIVQSELHRCLQDIEERKRSGRATLHIGGTPGVVGWLLTPAVLDLLRDDGDVNVDLFEAMPDDLLVKLQRGTVDVCVSTPLETGLDEGFAGIPLVREPTGVVAGPLHPLARKRGLRLGDLTSLRWLLPAGTLGWQQRFEDEFRAAGVHPPTRVFSTNSFLALRQMLLQTDAVALLPLDYVEVDLRARTMRRLAVTHQFADLEYLAYTRRVGTRPPLVDQFLERLLAQTRLRMERYNKKA